MKRDPHNPLSVQCPTCKAEPGDPCRRILPPAGEVMALPHSFRYELARTGRDPVAARTRRK